MLGCSLVCISSLATTPAPAPPPPSKDCVPDPAKWSHEHLERVALASIKSRLGQQLRPADIEIRFIQTLCDWFIEIHPTNRTDHLNFVAMISGATGKTKWVNKIEDYGRP